MTEQRLRLLWVDASGGPHIVLPELYASAWEGCFVPSGGRSVEALLRSTPDGQATDYDRACDVPGWLGSITVGPGHALVLSGDRTPVAYYHWRESHFLLRWVYAESETELLDHFHDVHAILPVDEEAAFYHPGGKIYLMDATDVPSRWQGQHTEFELPSGRYHVQTSHSRTEQSYIIVHSLRPK